MPDSFIAEPQADSFIPENQEGGFSTESPSGRPTLRDIAESIYNWHLGPIGLGEAEKTRTAVHSAIAPTIENLPWWAGFLLPLPFQTATPQMRANTANLISGLAGVPQDPTTYLTAGASVIPRLGARVALSSAMGALPSALRGDWTDAGIQGAITGLLGIPGPHPNIPTGPLAEALPKPGIRSPYSVLIPGDRATVSEAAQAAREGFESMPAQTRMPQPLKTAAQIAMEKATPEGSFIPDVGASHYGIMPETKPPIQYPEGRTPRTRTAEGGFVDLPDEGSPERAVRQTLALAFYSQLEKTVDEKMPNAATGQQIEGIIKSGGIKQEEIERTGVLDFLKSKQKFTKEEVLDHIRTNNVQVEEVVKGGDKVTWSPEFKRWIEVEHGLRPPSTPEGWVKLSEQLERQAQQWQRLGDERQAQRHFRLSEEAGQLAEGINPSTGSSRGQPKFSQWQLPGGENYRELLLTVPQRETGRLVELNRLIDVADDPAQRAALMAEKNRLLTVPQFFSSHFDEPNVLAHVRFNDRLSFDSPSAAVESQAQKAASDSLTANAKLLSDGVKSQAFLSKGLSGLDVEMRQSMLSGVVSTVGDSEIRRSVIPLIPVDVMDNLVRAKLTPEQFLSNKAMLTDSLSGNPNAAVKLSPDAVSRLVRTVADLTAKRVPNASKLPGMPIQSGSAPSAKGSHRGYRTLFIEEIQSDWAQGLRAGKDYPDMPFKKTWHELALKRILRYAAENDYDRIAWTTGKQQAARYDLSKQISKVRYNEKQGNLKAYDLRGEEVINQENVAPAKIEEYIGKEPAKKLIEAEKQVLTIVKSKEKSGFTKDRYLIKVGDTVIDVADGLDHAERLKSNFVNKYGQWQEIGGLDLKVGGEGMKGFYDQMLPSYMNNYAKKWGARVGTTDIGIPQKTGPGQVMIPVEPTTVHSIDITPSMKRDVLYKGQPRGFLDIPDEEEVSQAIKKAPAMAAARSLQPTDVSERVNRVIKEIEKAKPVRESQEAIYTRERAKRLAQVMSIRNRVGGEAGFRAEKGALSGELPKVAFESVRNKVGQQDIDELFNAVNRSGRITEWEKVNAKAGLSKLFGELGGEVPTRGEIDLLKEVFGPELVDAIAKKRPPRPGEGLIQTAGLIKSLRATWDLSAALRQGVFFVGRPKQWIPAFGKMLKYAFNKKSFLEGMEQIKSRPTYLKMRESKLSLSDLGSDMTMREEQIASKWLEKVPGVRPSNRAYTGFLNQLRADVFDDLLAKAESLGIANRPGFLKDLGRYINMGTGRGELGIFENASTPLAVSLFSPRLVASRLNLLWPNTYIKLDPFVRKQALRDLATFVGSGLTVLRLAEMGGAKAGTDPRSADFGKIKVGNTRYDIWGGFQQPVRGMAQIITGKQISTTTGREITLGEGYKPTSRLDIAARFLASKQAPVTSLISGFLEGQTTNGQPFNLPAEVADLFVPMILQDMADLADEKGWPSAWMAAPATFGVGVQTYGKQVPMIEQTPPGKEKVSFRNPPSLGERMVNKASGKKTTNIPKEFHGDLESVRIQDIDRKTKIVAAQRLTREDGKTRYVGNTRIYLQNGVVGTSTPGKVETKPNRVYERITGKKLRK